MAKSVEDFLIDFSKEEKGAGGGIKVKDGTYAVRCVAAKPVISGTKQTPGLQLTLMFTEGKYAKKKFTETLWATPKAYSRFRTLLEACGIKVPASVELTKIARAIKGKELYVEMETEERDGYKPRSRVTFEGFVHADNVSDDEDDEDDEDDAAIEDDDDDEEPAPKAKAKKGKAGKSKKAKADEDEDVDDDDLDLDEL